MDESIKDTLNDGLKFIQKNWGRFILVILILITFILGYNWIINFIS